MLFPTVSKIRMRFEECLVRLEILDAGIADCSKQLNVGTSIFGGVPELDELKSRCVHIYGILNRALDGLYAKSVTARQLAARLPNVDREITHLESLVEQIRKSISTTKAA
jgi:hypothetical protein